MMIQVAVLEIPDKVVCVKYGPYEERTYVPREALDKMANRIAELEDEIYDLQKLEDEIYGLHCVIGNMEEE